MITRRAPDASVTMLADTPLFAALMASLTPASVIDVEGTAIDTLARALLATKAPPLSTEPKSI